MQSSSNGMLPVLGLLACAAAAGVFAAQKWPKGPPDSLLEAWDFVSCELLHHHAPPAPRPDYGPAPKFDGPPTGLSAPPTVEFDPPAGNEGDGTRVELPVPSDKNPPPARPLDGGATLVPASITNPSPRPPPDPSSRREPPKTSAFWPNRLEDLLPGMKPGELSAPPVGPGGNGPAKSRLAAAPAAATSTPAEPRVEDFIRRLEQMGAVVVRLERQRGSAGNYVFRCELPMPQNPRYHRYFQAVDSQPARAAQRVTHEVEAWQATLKK